MGIEQFIAIGSICVALVVLRLMMNYNVKQSIERRKKEAVQRDLVKKCPGRGDGKMHEWKVDLVEEGYICAICGKKPGQFHTTNGEY